MDRPLKLPPITNKAVKKAIAEYEDLQERLADQHKLVTICEQRHATAAAESAGEHQALVQATREGMEAPARTTSNTELAASEARKQLLVLSDAVEGARDDVDKAVNDNIGEIMGTAEKRRSADRKAYLEGLNKLTPLSDNFDESNGELSFWECWQEDPKRASWPPRPRRARGLFPAGNQEMALPVSSALDLLREAEVAPTERRPIPGALPVTFKPKVAVA